jgi:hypothetical protein
VRVPANPTCHVWTTRPSPEFPPLGSPEIPPSHLLTSPD